MTQRTSPDRQPETSSTPRVSATGAASVASAAASTAPAAGGVGAPPGSPGSAVRADGQEGKGDHWAWKHAAQIAAVLTLVVSLMGYGVVLGVSATLGLDQGTVINGPFDLITLIWPGVLMMLSTVPKWDLGSLASALALPALGTAAAFAVAMLILPLPIALKAKMGPGRAILKSWIDLPKDGKPFRHRIAGAGVLSVLGGALTYGVTWLGVTGLYAAMILLATLPVLGYQTGRQYVQDIVFKPERCATPRGAGDRHDAGRASDPGSAKAAAGAASSGKSARSDPAACIAILSTDPTKPYLRTGRAVLGSATQMLIWDPETGESHRVPIANMEVVATDEAGIERLKKAQAEAEARLGAHLLPPTQTAAPAVNAASR